MTARHALPRRLDVPRGAPNQPVPPLVAEIREIVLRHVADLRFRWTFDAAEAAAYRILAEAEIAAGLRALPVLGRLEALHRPRRWSGSDVVVCDHCQAAWPCRDRQILSGELAEVAS